MFHRNIRTKRFSRLSLRTKPLIQTFKVSRTERPDCNLLPHYPNTFPQSDGGYKETTYRVLKIIENESGTTYTNFYVVPGPGFKKTEKTEYDMENTYEGQLAYAQCQPGWVEQIWVNDGKTKDAVPINARRCGIASVLTRLCLMDDDIKKPGSSNKALKKIEQQENVLQDVKANCPNAFVGLLMSANPKHAAYGYISAAMKENYEFLIVQERFRDEYHGFPLRYRLPEPTFSYYEIIVAKENYNPENGRIEACECNVFDEQRINTECHAFDGFWYFCK